MASSEISVPGTENDLSYISEKVYPTQSIHPLSDEPILPSTPTRNLDDVDVENEHSNQASENVVEDDETSNEPHSIYTRNQKKVIILVASIASFFSPMSANIYLPALNSIAKDLKVSNSLITLTVTSYLVREQDPVSLSDNGKHSSRFGNMKKLPAILSSENKALLNHHTPQSITLHSCWCWPNPTYTSLPIY